MEGDKPRTGIPVERIIDLAPAFTEQKSETYIPLKQRIVWKSFEFLHYPFTTLRDRKDRMSMYSGLEVRVPFCDHRIVEYAYNMPWPLKALHGREKGIVRAAFADELPEEIVDRKKSPYPKTFHPLYTELTASYVRQIFRDERSIASSLFNHEAIEQLMEQPESLAEPWYGQLMRTPQIFAYIIQLDRWFKRYGVTLK